VEQAKALVRSLGGSTPLIDKIVYREAFDDLHAILEAADVVMVARGDLGVEMSTEEVPTLQKRIIEMANGAGRAVITATQMLESMIENPRPTRAEASDVANAILDGTDAVMLSAETASGQHPVEAVEVMSRVAARIERELPRTSLPAPRPEAYGFSEAVAEAACRAAEVLRAKAIVAFTQSGFSARLISSERPHVPVVALTPFTEIQRRLGLYWGVRARLVRKVDTTDEMLQEVESTLLEDGTVRNGDVLVIISGGPMWVTGTTNLLKLHRVGERP
jgi:pyruvate kinase